MTEDELDLLASAYLDGEATSEEVAMVERDPALLARVEELRAVSEQVAAPVSPPAAGLKEQQLAAALSAFSLDGGLPAAPETEAAVSSDVIDLTSRSRATASGETGPLPSSPRDGNVAELPRRTIPTWLPAAAAFLLLAGGGALLLNQADGFGSDDSETAAFDTDAGSDTAEAESGEARAVAQADAAGAAESEMMESEEAMEEESEDAMEDDAMEEDSDAMANTDDDAADESAPAGEQDDGEPTDGEGGLFPDEPVLSFAGVPSAAQLPEDIPELRSNLESSLCGSAVAVPAGQSIAGYLPIEIAGELAELFILVDDAGEQAVAVTNSESCEVLE